MIENHGQWNKDKVPKRHIIPKLSIWAVALLCACNALNNPVSATITPNYITPSSGSVDVVTPTPEFNSVFNMRDSYLAYFKERGLDFEQQVLEGGGMNINLYNFTDYSINPVKFRTIYDFFSNYNKAEFEYLPDPLSYQYLVSPQKRQFSSLDSSIILVVPFEAGLAEKTIEQLEAFTYPLKEGFFTVIRVPNDNKLELINTNYPDNLKLNTSQVIYTYAMTEACQGTIDFTNIKVDTNSGIKHNLNDDTKTMVQETACNTFKIRSLSNIWHGSNDISNLRRFQIMNYDPIPISEAEWNMIPTESYIE